MQTRDHRKLAELLATEMGENVPYCYKKVFILGNIEPDLNPFTYLHGFAWGEKLHGHNYENILLVMRKLFDSVQRQERFGIWRYYHLGKLTHYVADAFTFPHNKKFCGNLKEHRRYEKTLHDQFRNVLQKQVCIRKGDKGIHSFHYIEVLHKEYLEKAGTYDIDCRYILQAVVMLLRWSVVINWMKRNHKEVSIDTVDNDWYVFYKRKYGF